MIQLPAATLSVDGEPVAIADGDSLASCLMRSGRIAFRRSPRGHLRGVYCGIGVCNECLVTLDGRPNVRACVTEARPGAHVETETGH
jgi:predicted molibdopterin-dependent oxidoreductase YjgC